jgi:hypothetical protein
MKLRNEISELNEQGPTVIFPVANQNFDLYRQKLRRVIEANFDYPVVNTLEYYEYSQVFSITLSVGGVLGGHEGAEEDCRTGFTLHKCVEINPAHPLSEQITEALKTCEYLRARHQLMSSLLNEHVKADT